MADDSKDALGKAYVEIHASLENLGKEIAGAKKLVLKELDGIEAGTKRAAAKTNSLGDAITGFYKKNKESFKATGEAIALTAGAIGTIATAIVALGARGSEIADVRQAFVQLTASAGDSNTVLQTVRGSVDGMISDFDLMKSVNGAFAQGLQLTQAELKTTGEAARVVASRIGGDTKEAYDTLLTAMATGRDMTLKTISVNIDAKRAVEAFAAGLGVSSDKLSENQQRLAKQQAIMAELNRIMAESGRADLSFGDRLTQMKVGIANFVDGVAEGIAQSPVFAAGLKAITDGLADAFGTDSQGLIKKTIHYAEIFAESLIDAGQVAISVASTVVAAYKRMQAGFFNLVSAFEQKRANELQETIKAYEKIVAQDPVGRTPGGRSAGNRLSELRAEQAWYQGAAMGAANEATNDAAEAKTAAETFDRLSKVLATARAEMAKAEGQGPKTAAAIKKVGGAAQDTGNAVIVTAEELKKFHAELRAIQDAGDQALTASLLTGTQAQLAALAAETKSAIATARENAKTRGMGEQTVTAITEAEANKRQAILNTEARDVAAELRGVYASIAQAQIAASLTGLQATLASLDAERTAAVEEATFRGLTADSLAKVLLGIDAKYTADRRRILVENERDIQRELAGLAHDRAAIAIDAALTGVDAQLAANDLELKDRLHTIALEKNSDARLVAETIALYADRAKQIIRSNDPVWKAWQGLNADMRGEWADTWAGAVTAEVGFIKSRATAIADAKREAHSSVVSGAKSATDAERDLTAALMKIDKQYAADRTTTLVNALLKPYKDLGKQLLSIFTGILADIEAAFMKPLQQMLSGVVSNMMNAIGGPTGGSGTGAPKVDLSALMQSFTHPTTAQKLGMVMVGVAGTQAMMAAKTTKGAVASGAVAGAGYGAAIGSVIPGVGTAVGAGVGAAVGAIAGWYKARKLAKQSVKEFEAGFGGIDKLAAEMQVKLGKVRADALIKDLEGVGTDLKKAGKTIGEITDELNAATAAQERWNLSASDLTPANRAQALKDTYAGMVKDFNALVNQGYDPTKIVAKMSDSLSQLVVDAMDTGQKIPAAMRPLLETLIRSGKLSDELRDKLLGVADGAIGDWQDLEDTATKYGITIDSLGPRFQQSKLSATAAQIAKDFDKLVKAGGDVNGLLDGMQDEVQNVVTQALKFGLDVPASMKGMIEQLAAMGKLTDENGNALTDLGRLNFAKPLEETVDQLIAKLNELIETMAAAYGLPARDINDPLGPHGGRKKTASGDGPLLPYYQGPGGTILPEPIPQFAHGGFGDFGRGSLAMLHGREAVFPLDRLEAAMSKSQRKEALIASQAPQILVQVDQKLNLNSPDAGAMRRLVRGDLKDEFIKLVKDDADGFGRALADAMQRFMPAEAL